MKLKNASKNFCVRISKIKGKMVSTEENELKVQNNTCHAIVSV